MKKLVMLETSQYSDIQIKLDGKLHLEDGSSIALKSYAHFYLIDTDTEIKEGDWYIDLSMRTSNYGLHKCDSKRLETISKHFKGQFAVVLTSTDNIENIPQLSEQSIKLAIDYFNRTGKREVEVDVEEIHEKIAIYNFAMGLDEEVISKIKFNPEGKVDITLPEEEITITIPTDIAETLVAVIDSRIGTSDDDEFNRQMHIVLKEIDKKLRR